MKLRWFAGLLWLGLILEAFLLAPASTPDIAPMVWKMISMKVQGIEPWVFAIFNSLGIFPMIYACLLLPEPKAQRTPAWPFVMGSFALGAFALFPYFWFRNFPANPIANHEPLRFWQRWLESKALAAFLLLGACSLLFFGAWKGTVSEYARMWKVNQLVHVMSFDFLALSLLCPWVIKQDWSRRGNFSKATWLLCCVPVLGGALYLLIRPRTT